MTKRTRDAVEYRRDAASASRSLVVTAQAESRRYPVVIGAGLLNELGWIVRDVAPSHRCTLAVDANLARSHGVMAARSLAEAGFVVNQIELAAMEWAKTPQTVGRIHQSMLRSRHERSSPLIALGGGVVGDTAGFAAATFHRGVPLVHAPTTLLAMVDASIGGKTAVNLIAADDDDSSGESMPQVDSDDGPESRVAEPMTSRLVKNVIGSFHQPSAVVIDPVVLRTLDRRELRCGLAECIKHAVLADDGLLEFIEDRVALLLKPDLDAATELIERSVSVKIAFVEADPLETTGRRSLLNLGHTFAHAIEPIEVLGLKHGEAVAIGLCAATDVAARMGAMAAGSAERVRRIIAACGLPVRLTEPLLIGPLVDAMKLDKKVVDGRVRLVVPLEPGVRGGAELRDDVPQSALEAAWASVGAE